MIIVVLPTITGREEYLRVVYEAYCQTLAGTVFSIMVEQDAPNWPTACNRAVEKLLAIGPSGPPDEVVLHFGADDLVPRDGWWLPVKRALWPYDENLVAIPIPPELPAPFVYRGELVERPRKDWARAGRYRVDSYERQHGDHDGASDQLTGFSRVPALTVGLWKKIGPWPELDYYADCWLGEAARKQGYQTRLYSEYAFTHLWAQQGRLDTEERLRVARDGYEQALAAL